MREGCCCSFHFISYVFFFHSWDDLRLARVLLLFFCNCFNGEEKVVGRKIKKQFFLGFFPQRVQFLNVSQFFFLFCNYIYIFFFVWQQNMCVSLSLVFVWFFFSRTVPKLYEIVFFFYYFVCMFCFVFLLSYFAWEFLIVRFLLQPATWITS